MTKKYILKPGRHQFAPSSHAIHQDSNLSDEEAEWYLKRYPHILSMFTSIDDIKPEIIIDTDDSTCRVSVSDHSLNSIQEPTETQTQIQQNEDLPATN